jgi:hypothetical protein
MAAAIPLAATLVAGQLAWTTWVIPLMICCTAIAESIMPASRVTSTTPPS